METDTALKTFRQLERKAGIFNGHLMLIDKLRFYSISASHLEHALLGVRIQVLVKIVGKLKKYIAQGFQIDMNTYYLNKILSNMCTFFIFSLIAIYLSCCLRSNTKLHKQILGCAAQQ